MIRETLSHARELKEVSSIRGMDGTMVENEFSAYTRDAFNSARRLDRIQPLVIPARNEEEDLPGTLLAAARTGEALPIVLDNNSSDRTAEIARHMGAITAKVEHGNKMAATQEGLRIASQELGARAVYLTDADTLVPRLWIASMNRELEKADAGNGAAIFGNPFLWHGPSRFTDSVLNIAKLTRAVKQSITNGDIIARGANYAVQLDEEGRMLAALNNLDGSMFNGDDYHIKEALVNSGAAVRNTARLDTAVVSRNDRVTSLTSRLRKDYAKARDAEYSDHYQL